MGMEKKLAFLGIERSHHDGVRGVFPRRKRAPRQIEKVTPVRKKIGPPVGGLIFRWIERGQRCGFSAGGGYFVQGGIDARSKYNDPFSIPSATARKWGVAKGQRGATGSFNFLEFTVREKSDESAVGRPKGISGAFGASQELRLQRIDGTYPQ